MENPVTFEEFSANITNILPSTDLLLWSLFGVIALYTAIHALVFLYHFHKYNIAPGPFLQLTYVIYLSGITFFLGVMFLSLLVILY